MTISEARREASRTNGRRGRGPLTPETRRKSAANGVTHGFAGSGAFLPEAMQAQVEAMARDYEAKIRPRDESERSLVRTAALNMVRWLQLTELQGEAAAFRVSAATKQHDDARADEVVALAARLDAEPAEALRLLERTSDGCERISWEWADLAGLLERHGWLDEAETLRLWRLLGQSGDGPARSIAPALAEVWEAAALLRSARGPQPDAAEAAPVDPIEIDDAFAFLLDLATDRAEQYRLRGARLWAEIDEPARKLAPRMALADLSPEGRRLARYLNDAERKRRRALEELARLRALADAAPPPAELTALPPRRANPARRSESALTPELLAALSWSPPSPPPPADLDQPAARTEPDARPAAPLAPTEPEPAPCAPTARTEVVTRAEDASPGPTPPGPPEPAPPVARSEPKDLAPPAAEPPAKPRRPDLKKLEKRRKQARRHR